MDDAPVSAEAPAPDLVETLRAEGRHFRGEPDCVGQAVTLLVERAADTITALRADIINYKIGNKDLQDHCTEITSLTAENERLMAELRTAADMNVVYEGRLQEKEAENERLRAALRGAYEVFAGSDGFIPETCAEGYQQQIIKQMVDCISAALKEDRT
jgi:hypothetical protein